MGQSQSLLAERQSWYDQILLLMLCRSDPSQARGKADVAALEWGTSGYVAAVENFATTPYDLIVASDCTYIDRAKFRSVQQIARNSLPEGYQLEHIDVWELQL